MRCPIHGCEVTQVVVRQGASLTVTAYRGCDQCDDVRRRHQVCGTFANLRAEVGEVEFLAYLRLMRTEIDLILPT